MANKHTKQLVKAYNEMYDALEYYQQGIDHFYKCINFGKSALDGEAITFMNDSNIKISQALREAKKLPKLEAV